MIRLKNVSKRFTKNTEATLKNVDLYIKEGEMVSIMGPSGSGKSTLLNIIGLIDAPTEGSYHLENIDTSTVKSKYHKYRNQKVGFIFQHFSLLDDYTVLENVMLPLVYRGIPHKKRVQVSEEMLEKVGLKAHAKKYPSQLSGGEQQRTAIARVLAQNPSIILADEPTGALDQKNGEKIMGILKEINNQGKTLLVVTHDQNVANSCDRTIHLLDGKISSTCFSTTLK
ncbi:ABC transporter ATP-binding protein [Priestia koreensis]|uniref:ABC transporter ATP-binding protein n=1 Tax=Priestia koreensis TaxID=284581 RepID=UPI003019420F